MPVPSLPLPVNPGSSSPAFQPPGNKTPLPAPTPPTGSQFPGSGSPAFQPPGAKSPVAPPPSANPFTPPSFSPTPMLPGRQPSPYVPPPNRMPPARPPAHPTPPVGINPPPGAGGGFSWAQNPFAPPAAPAAGRVAPPVVPPGASTTQPVAGPPPPVTTMPLPGQVGTQSMPWVNQANQHLPWNQFGQMLQHFAAYHNGNR